MIQYQILQTNITRTVWEIVRRFNNKILGVKQLIIFRIPNQSMTLCQLQVQFQ